MYNYIMSLDQNYFYDEKKYCFYIKEEGKSFEDLYALAKLEKKNDSNNKNNNNIISFEYENKIYLFNNPHKIDFEFPDNNKKSIFISNYNQFIYLLRNYKDYNIYYYIDSNISFKNIFPQKDLPYIKIIIKDKVPEKQEYELANKKVDISNIYPKDLSLNFDEYFENHEYIEDNKPYFKFSEQRRQFFEFLKNELKNNYFIGLCGPKGIGKTASILTFCKINSLDETPYFYFNIKAIIKNSKDLSKIFEIISNELSHCLGEQYILQYTKLLKKQFISFENPLDILIYMIENFKKFVPEIIIVDQYKTKYDYEYIKLKKIHSLASKYFYKVIFISSTNEEDVKLSLISSLKKENKLFFEYIYISSLLEVTKEDRQKLGESELNLLDGFGNYYFIYYMILKEKKNFENNIVNITFDEKFLSLMNDYYEKGLERYFDKKDKSLIDTIRFLLIETRSKIKLEEFLNNSDNIPFRFFKIKYNDKNFFKLSEISKDSDIYLDYQSNYVINCLFYYYTKFINTQKLLITSNFTQNLEEIKLEDSISLYLWVMRNKSPIYGLKIYQYISVDSIFEPTEKDIKSLKSLINELNVKDIFNNFGILIKDKIQNSLHFNICIIKKIKHDLFEIYYFQTTLRKDEDERFTLIFLNENLSYVTYLYELKLDIIVNNYYFYYIFDDKFQDLQAMKECSKNYINSLKFNTTSYLFSSNTNYHLFQYIPKIRLFLDSKLPLPKEDSIMEINTMSAKDIPKEERELKLELTKIFLGKKRQLKTKKNLPEEYKNILNEYKNYYKTVTKNNKYEISYDEKESSYNDFLFQQNKFHNIPGITYKINSNSVNSLITKNLSPLTKEEIFNIIGLSQDYDILSIKLVRNVSPLYHIPKKGNYLFMKYNSKEIYYFDYIKFKKINVFNKQETDFDGTYRNLSEYYLISTTQKIKIFYS